MNEHFVNFNVPHIYWRKFNEIKPEPQRSMETLASRWCPYTNSNTKYNVR